MVCKMKHKLLIKSIAVEIQIFKKLEQKEIFLFVLGGLVTRVISLQKASEMMEIEPDMFLNILDIMGIEFSYLSDEDVPIEQGWL